MTTSTKKAKTCEWTVFAWNSRRMLMTTVRGPYDARLDTEGVIEGAAYKLMDKLRVRDRDYWQAVRGRLVVQSA